ncbi:hypothetical protein ACFE04_024710 [Oxalis oulophora]
MTSSFGEVGVLKGQISRHLEEDEDNSNSPDGEEIAIVKEEPFLSKVERSSMEINLKDSFIIDHKNQDDYESIRSAKAKMGEIREENEKLKALLSKTMKEYQSLQVHFFDIVKQSNQNRAPMAIDTAVAPNIVEDNGTHHDQETRELVMLSLGRSKSPKKSDEKKGSDSIISKKEDDHEEILSKGGGLALGLELNSSTPENSCEDSKEEDANETWPPSKALKTKKSRDDDQEVAQQTLLKKARVSVRARCDARTINDGCQWRKYGQKIAKGNPCPRAYYRCTASPTCPVRKQVQRCVNDMSVLITTYEGTHNHPLPISATAMASTTSAAASMLQSQSLSSQPGGSFAAPLSSTQPGLNFSNNNFPQNTRPNIYFPYNSSISNSNLHPTITLDLTTPQHTTQPFNRLFSNYNINQPKSLSFSSAPNTYNNNAGYHYNYGTSTSMSYNRNQYNVGSLNLGRQEDQHFRYQHSNYNNINNQQQVLNESIAAATKVIASNPNFRSALEAAITSFVGNNNGGSDVPKENGDRI